jgi:hypothetical protein
MTDVNEVKAMLEGGMSAAAVAAELGISETYIYKLAKGLGIDVKALKRAKSTPPSTSPVGSDALDDSASGAEPEPEPEPGQNAGVVAVALEGKIRGRAARLTEDEVVELIDAYNNGGNVGALTLKYGLSYNAFYGLLRIRGVKYREMRLAEKDDRQARVERAVEMYQKGFKLLPIEIETGIRQPIIHAELARRGIPLRRSGSGSGSRSGDAGVMSRKDPGADEDLLAELEELSDRERALLMPGEEDS